MCRSAGYFRGLVDIGIMRVMDIILAFLSLLLALVLVTILEPSLVNAMIAISLVYKRNFVCLARAAVWTKSQATTVPSLGFPGSAIPG